MAPPTSPLHQEEDSVALLVARSLGGKVLCPFYAKCEELVLIDRRTMARRCHANPGRSNQSVSDLILASGATRLVCGFISPPDKLKLRAAGIDVRVGSCLRSIDDLVRSFNELPHA